MTKTQTQTNPLSEEDESTKTAFLAATGDILTRGTLKALGASKLLDVAPKDHPDILRLKQYLTMQGVIAGLVGMLEARGVLNFDELAKLCEADENETKAGRKFLDSLRGDSDVWFPVGENHVKN